MALALPRLVEKVSLCVEEYSWNEQAWWSAKLKLILADGSATVRIKSTTQSIVYELKLWKTRISKS